MLAKVTRLAVLYAFLFALCAPLPLAAAVSDAPAVANAAGTTWFWGDENCDGAINALDTLTLLFQRTDGEPNLPANCPIPGTSVFRADNDEEVWSDLNCTANFDDEEALFPIRFLSFGFTGPGGNCPAVGEQVHTAD